jgi:hypothetical protein
MIVFRGSFSKLFEIVTISVSERNGVRVMLKFIIEKTFLTSGYVSRMVSIEGFDFGELLTLGFSEIEGKTGKDDGAAPGTEFPICGKKVKKEDEER